MPLRLEEVVVNGSAEPLKVRVARALGCKPYQPVNSESEAAKSYWICPCQAPSGGTLHGGQQPELCGIDKHWQSPYWLLPYGDETPEGWACTGPLIARREIALLFHCPGWIAVAVHGGQDTRALGPCEAVAELIAAGAR